MNRAVWCLICLLPPAALLAAEAPVERPRDQSTIIIDKEVPLEDLAYSYLFRSGAAAERLRGLISEAGIARIVADVAEHDRRLNDPQPLREKLRLACNDALSVRTGSEFVAALRAWEADDRRETRQVVRDALSKLDATDRQALENYLDTKFRTSFTRVRLDLEAAFVSAPFPNTRSDAITRQVCYPDLG